MAFWLQFEAGAAFCLQNPQLLRVLIYLLTPVLSQDAGGPNVKKPVKLGSVSPAHREVCTDPKTDLTPATPPLKEDKDDYRDDTCPGKTCLEEAEELARSPDAESGGLKSGTPTGRSTMRRSPAKPSLSPVAPTGNVTFLLKLTSSFILARNRVVAEKPRDVLEYDSEMFLKTKSH